ncbi:hypothetical protein B0H11DRAFT_1910427 [Mycena galericulata]|nr:hypothetical protein B0H11DRAFT_1910427 [Mycena galericulata]
MPKVTSGAEKDPESDGKNTIWNHHDQLLGIHGLGPRLATSNFGTTLGPKVASGVLMRGASPGGLATEVALDYGRCPSCDGGTHGLMAGLTPGLRYPQPLSGSCGGTDFDHLTFDTFWAHCTFRGCARFAGRFPHRCAGILMRTDHRTYDFQISPFWLGDSFGGFPKFTAALVRECGRRDVLACNGWPCKSIRFTLLVPSTDFGNYGAFVRERGHRDVFFRALARCRASTRWVSESVLDAEHLLEVTLDLELLSLGLLPEADGVHASAKGRTCDSVWWTGGHWGFIPGKRELFPHTSIFCWWSGPTGFYPVVQPCKRPASSPDCQRLA